MIPRPARFAALILLLSLAATVLRADPPPWLGEFPGQDWQSAAVDLSTIRSGGPPRDGIPALDAPRFIDAATETRIDGREPVLTLEMGGEARAYPIRYLIWHEIANDTVAGVPVAVTYCPLCNSAMVFDRRLDGKVLSFGVSGRLRQSDMVMYDRQSESFWQQALGQGIVGRHAGRDLTQLPAWMEDFATFRTRNPDGRVMDEPDWRRAYGRNPYAGYDSGRPFLYTGEDPPHGIDPLERVVRVGNRAWPFARLFTAGEIDEAGVTIRWEAGQASALDSARIAEGRDVGRVRVQDERGRDLPHDLLFAFAFHAFWPEGIWMLGN
ncbi:MAG: DUF3179 domain-containing protein [Paracoccaceae bacterium]